MLTDHKKTFTRTVANMTIQEVATEIVKCIKLLEAFLKQLDELSAAKATTAADYDKAMAEAVRRLRPNEPATVIPTLAKGECSEYKLAMDQAKEKKADMITRLEIIKAVLNGWQSIHKHFDVI